MIINGIFVEVIGGEISNEEIESYIEHVETKNNRKLRQLKITIDGDFVELAYKFEPVRFERIRRITGYLTGDVNSWNDAKTAELKDRVKHGTDMELDPAWFFDRCDAN